MKFYIDKLDLHINVEPSTQMALSAFCYLRSPKSKIPNKVKFEDLVQHHNELGVVVDTQGVYASVQYVECANGKFSDAGDNAIVRMDELTKIDPDNVTDTVQAGAAQLYRSLGRQEIDYSQPKTDKWW